MKLAEDVYIAIPRLKRVQCMQQRQAARINNDILVKITGALPNTLTGTQNKAHLSMGYDFLAHHSELVALQSSGLTLTKDGSLIDITRSK